MTHSEAKHRRHPPLPGLSRRQPLLIDTGTRRDFGNCNLETDVLVVADKHHPAIAKGLATFHRLWSNQGDVAYTQAFEAFADDSSIKYAIYRMMESTGLSRF